MLFSVRNISLLLESTFQYLCVVLLFGNIVKSDLIDEVEQRPQIYLRDGNMILQSAAERNIYLEAHGGTIYLNGDDLLRLARSVIEAADTVNTLREGLLTDFENRINNLERTVLGGQGLENRVTQMEQSIANSTSSVDLPGNVNTKIKSLFSKVMRLTQIVGKIRTSLSTNECSSNPCRNGGTCEDLYNSFICRCPPNWEGTLCDIDVNECAQFAGTDLGCQNGATCLNRLGTYECQCPSGYYGLHCTRQNKECSRNNPQELCGHGICINQEGTSDGYTCLCDQGWTTALNSKACTQDIDECSSGRPACSKNPPVSCINLPGTFHCGPCPQGYTGNGFYCIDIDECQINNGGCSTNPSVQCINTQGSRMCGVCPPGFQGDGVTCTYVGACRVNNGGCHPLAQCIENSAISQSYVQCICPTGYVGSGVGLTGCLPSAASPSSGIASVCQPNPCAHGACEAAGNMFVCHCFPGYTGSLCNAQLDPCSSNPCQNGGTCMRQGNGYYCRCSQLATGMHCEQQQMSCGGRLRSEAGVLKFPPAGTGISYPAQLSCGWQIITNISQVLNVTFTSFNLEESPDCNYDWLQIHDGPSSAYPMKGRYCGTRAPNDILSTHNVLYFWFRSDRSNQRDGFELSWTSIPPVCGGNIVFQSHGSLSSPGYPGKYPINRDCEWQLRAPSGKRIVLHFYTMNIENHLNCSFDFVEILDGYSGQVLKKFCNSSLPEPMTTPSQVAKIRFHSDSIGRDSGFQISYAATHGSECGGYLTNPSGIITPPIDPETNKYQHRVTCEWVIQYPEESRVQIQFLKLSLETSRGCTYDSLQIYNGRGSESSLVGRYCGIKLPRPYTSSGNILTIIFSSDSSLAFEGFKIKYREVCGGIFGESTGHFSSPHYPSTYPKNKNCVYEIQQPLGKSIILNFADFELESRYSRSCYDSVEIRDGHGERAPLLGEPYCGSQFPPTTVSTYNYLWISFRTDSSRQYRGFYANYTTQDISCGGIVRNQQGTIQTPNYPSVYPHNQICRWVIVADEGNVITLNWLIFNLEGGSSIFGGNCMYDYVEVYENVTERQSGLQIGNQRFCGAESPPNMTSTSNIITILFRTDSSIRYAGFVVQYSQSDASHICSATFVSPTGTILSPEYPNRYPHNKDCIWTITVPTGQQILLNISDFQLERHSSCNWDYLEIRNGGHATSPLIGKFCGNTIQTPIPSISNQMYLHFVTDYSLSGRGFNITWDGTVTGCGGTLSGKSGHIVSPYYPHQYSVNTECAYRISTSQGSIVQIVFLDFDLESSRGCLFDYLAFYDGLDSSGKLLGRYCSNNHPPMIRSKSNTMFIKFKSDASHHGRGFSIKYDTVCDLTIGGFEGVIESPSFPNQYPRNMHCKWTIQVKTGNFINITFSHFSLERTEHCSGDYVEIAEASENEILFTRNAKLCGSNVPDPIHSSSNKVMIEMKTDDSLQFSGFRLEWYLDGCGGHLTDPHGQFTSPGYPNGYRDNVQCEWLITVEVDKSIEITLEDFDIESARNCYYDVLTVYGGPDINSPKLHNGLCHVLSEKIKLTSSGNNMFLTFKADGSYSGRGFKITYKSVPTVCGGIFTSPSGHIHSHNYPNNYDPHDDCIWYIQVEKNHVVQFTFLVLDLETHANCSYDYVKLFDGNSTESPVITTLCGNDLPNVTTYRSTGNTMVVRMKADGSNSFPGFLANYTTACGARIVTEDYGSLILSDAINANRENENCSWIIMGSQTDDRVTLTINHMDLITSTENGGGTCEFGYLEVYDGEDESTEPLGTYCGSSIPPQITSHGSALLVRLVSKYGFHYGYFSASYSVIQGACGGNLTSEHGAFASPEYPSTYPVNAECVWTISSSPGNRVSIGFRSFELEQSDSCNNDYLEVRENSAEGNLIGVYCTDLPSNITASQTLWIKFHSDSEGTAQGFLADYSLLHGNDLQGESGVIASPLYPRPYLQESGYSWRISVPVGSAIRITFREFYIESFTDTCSLYLAVYDGYDDTAPELMKKCGTLVPDPIISSSNMVYIFMSTMGVRRGSLFLLEWLQVERVPELRPTEITNLTCGGMIYLGNHTSNNTVTEYTISSPGYPHGYRQGLNCEWIVQTPPLFHPALLITAMDLERSARCFADYLSVYTATEQSGNWKLIKTLCFNNASSEPPIEADSLMKIVFTSDFSINGTGFSAKVYPVCGGSITATNGVIEVDNTTTGVHQNRNYYVECNWNVTVRPGRTIRVLFDRFYIRSDVSNTCTYQYLKLQSGHYLDSPPLGQNKYCGSNIPDVPNTMSNHLSITYKNINEAQGFKLRFFEVSATCGGSITLTQFNNLMEISSPNFPNSPPPHTECIWTFMAPGGEALQVDFDRIFDFKYEKNCEHDYIELRDGGTERSRLINRFCRLAPSTQKSTRNMLWIKHFSDIFNHPSRFRANVSIASCGGVIRQNGEIRSPGYPAKYPSNSQCTWRIETHYHNSILLNFRDLDLPSVSVCNRTDHLTIREMTSLSPVANVLQTLCGRNLPEPIGIQSNVALIDFTSLSSQSEQYRGFHLNFSFAFKVCDGEMTTPFGEIKSPGYPSGTQYLNCRWTITVPKGKRITLTIVTADMDFTERHTSDISFYNYQYPYFIDSMWRNRTLRIVESSGYSMKIYLYSRSTQPARVFLRYSSDQPAVCGGNLEERNGSLTLPQTYGQSFYCEWEYTLESLENATVAVTFQNVTIGRPRNFYTCAYYGSKIQVIAENDLVLYMTCDNHTQPFTVVSPLSKTKIIVSQSAAVGTVNGLIQYVISPCGGVLTGPEETLTSPRYPSNYPANVHCAWAVRFQEDQRISVTFNYLQLEDQCKNDYLKIYNGPLPTSPLIDQLCGSNLPQDSIISESNSLWIEFHSNGDAQFKGFSITLSSFSTGCGGILHGENRNISSPYYPRQYPPNIDCEWEMRTEVGNFIQLQFIERFQLEQSDQCKNDFVEIFDYLDNEYVVTHKLCGRDVPRLLNSTGTRMKLRFKSNGDIQGDGFKALWYPQCGGLIENITSGYIVSPGYPNNYGLLLDCNYTVDMPGHFIRAQFDTFNIEGGTCRYDNVTIYRPESWATSRTLGPYCGTKIPPSFMAAGRFSLIFQTDSSVTRSGFLLRFSSITSCGGNLNEPGTIVSPDVYMDFYFVEINCTWIVTAPVNSVILVRFSSFLISSYMSCERSSHGLSIYDGPYVDLQYRKGMYCGNLDKSPPIFQSSGNKVILEYVTHSHARMNHFNADVIFTYGEAVGCGGRKNVTTQAQTIQSPDVNNDGYYEPSLDCHWVLSAPENQVIRLQINNLQVKPCTNTTTSSSNYCGCDYIEIHDGGTQYGELIGVYCGSNAQRPIISSSTQLWIRFVTDGVAEDRGFSIEIKAQEPLCSTPLLNVTASAQVLTSNNYPNNYPPDLRCRWLINTPRHYDRIAIHIEDLNITGEEDCSTSKLQISDDDVSDVVTEGVDGSMVIFGQPANIRPVSILYASRLPISSYTFCGEVREFNYYSLTGRVSVTFVSNEMVARGFNLTYSLAGCNRNYTTSQGRILINGVTRNCLILIEPPENNATISLYFNAFYTACDPVGLEIRDGALADSPLISSLCGGNIPNPVFSTGNALRLEINKYRPSIHIDVTYTTTNKGRGCGGNIFNYGGTFTSPLYPANIRNASYCQWNITVPVGNLVTLKFKEFQIGPRSTCDSDYVDLIDVEMPNNVEGAQSRYCGDDIPALFTSSSNRLILRYTTSVHNAGTGWVATFMATPHGQRMYDPNNLYNYH